MGPEAAGAQSPYHRTFSEAFFVVSGTVRLFEGLVELADGRWKPSHEELQEFMEEHDNIYV